MVLMGNLDTIICPWDWLWLSSDLAFDSPWDSSGSSYRDVTRSDSLLGTTLEAPLTAIALSLGFTGQTWSLTIPLALAAGLSYVIQKKWEKK